MLGVVEGERAAMQGLTRRLCELVRISPLASISRNFIFESFEGCFYNRCPLS